MLGIGPQDFRCLCRAAAIADAAVKRDPEKDGIDFGLFLIRPVQSAPGLRI